MKFYGKTMGDHVRLLAPLFGFILAVFLARVLLHETSAPGWITRLFSLTGILPIVCALAVFRIHFRRFGGYLNVVVASLLLNAFGQFLIIAAIAFSVLSGVDNVYTVPEFSFPGDDETHRLHIYGHLTFGIALGSLLGAALGSLFLWLLRRLLPARENSPSASAQ